MTVSSKASLLMTKTVAMAEMSTPTNIHTKAPVRKPSRGGLDSMTPPRVWTVLSRSDTVAGAWERL